MEDSVVSGDEETAEILGAVNGAYSPHSSALVGGFCHPRRVHSSVLSSCGRLSPPTIGSKLVILEYILL